MATKRRKRYLENVGGYDTINSRYGSGDFYRPVVGPNLPELVVTPYGKVSYASTDGDFGTRFLTRGEWLNKNSKTSTSSSVSTLGSQKSSQEVQARMKEAYDIINGAHNQLIENNRPVYKVGGAKRSIRNAGRYNKAEQFKIIQDYNIAKEKERVAANKRDADNYSIFALPKLYGRIIEHINFNQPNYSDVLNYEDWLIKNGYRSNPLRPFRGKGTSVKF